MIKRKDLYEFWKKNHNFKNTCNDTEGSNIIKLVKQIPKIYVKKILQIIKFYMISIKKKFLLSNHVLEIYNYLKNGDYIDNTNLLHILYELVRDYWMILKVNGHPGVAICYYNKAFDLYDNEETFLEKEILESTKDSINFMDSDEFYEKVPTLFIGEEEKDNL